MHMRLAREDARRSQHERLAAHAEVRAQGKGRQRGVQRVGREEIELGEVVRGDGGGHCLRWRGGVSGVLGLDGLKVFGRWAEVGEGVPSSRTPSCRMLRSMSGWGRGSLSACCSCRRDGTLWLASGAISGGIGSFFRSLGV